MANPKPELDDAALARLLHASRQMWDAPEAVVQRALQVWQDPPGTAAPSWVQGLRALVATLRFDSLVTPTLGLGLRAAGGSAVRQLLFAVEGRDVDLRIEASGSGYWRVFGQVLGPDTAGTARWQCEGGLCVDATWSELAEFEFEAVPAGAATLVLTGVGWTTAIAVDAERT